MHPDGPASPIPDNSASAERGASGEILTRTEPAQPAHAASRRQWLAVCVAAGALAVGYLQARNSQARDTVLSLAAIALIVMIFRPRLIGLSRSAARAFGIVVIAVVLSGSIAALVNKKYVRATIEELPRSEAFRKSLRLTHWPIYGRSEFSRWPHALLVFPAAGLLGYWALGRGRRMALGEDHPAPALAGLCAASAMTMVTFGFSERLDRWAEVFYASNQFVRDANQFATVGELLSTYTARMKDFSWFGHHYPPGNALVLGWLGVAGKYLFLLSAALSPALVWLANRSLGGSKSAGWWSAALVAVAPVVLMQATISTTILVLALAAAGWWLLGICLRQSTGASLAAATGFGLLVAFWSFFSFGVAIYLVMLAMAVALWICTGHANWRRFAACAAIAAFSLVFAVALFWLASGYDTLATFREATANHFEQIGGRKIPPAEPVGRWLLRSLGNIVAFAFGHLPLVGVSVLALALTRGRGPAMAALVPATIATVLLAGFSGTFTIETDRVWLFLVPPLALAGGWWLAHCEREVDANAPAAVVAFSLCLGVAIELTFWPYL